MSGNSLVFSGHVVHDRYIFGGWDTDASSVCVCVCGASDHNNNNTIDWKSLEILFIEETEIFDLMSICSVLLVKMVDVCVCALDSDFSFSLFLAFETITDCN